MRDFEGGTPGVTLLCEDCFVDDGPNPLIVRIGPGQREHWRHVEAERDPAPPLAILDAQR